MSLEIGPENLPDLLAGLGMLAIAALLLWVAPHDRVHRAFALLQVLNGAASLSYVAIVGYAETDPVLSRVWSHMIDYFTIALAFAVAFFALRFIEPRTRRLSQIIAWGLLLAVAVILFVYANDHSLVSSRGEDGQLRIGPLGFLEAGFLAAFGGMSLGFALAACRPTSGSRRAGLVLAALAFMVLPTFWGVLDWAAFFTTPEGTWSTAARGSPAALFLFRATVGAGGLMAMGAAIAIVAARPLRTDPSLGTYRAVLVLGFGLTILIAVFMVFLFWLDPVRFARWPYTTDGALRVVMTVILAYALLRRQIFDKEVRLRFAISRSSIAATFIAVFFVGSEAAQQFFGETLESTYLGIAAAGALVFAIAPLQRAAERLAEKAVPAGPAGAPPPAGDRARNFAEETYTKALRIAARDRQLTREEQIHLAELAEALGIGAGRAAALLHEVQRAHEVAT